MKNVLEDIDTILQKRKQSSEHNSYVSSLYKKGLEAILKKIAEEAAETIMAAKDTEANSTKKNKEHLIYEISDLWFHCIILLAQNNLSSQDILAELKRRLGTSGIEEKAHRRNKK